MKRSRLFDFGVPHDTSNRCSRPHSAPIVMHSLPIHKRAVAIVAFLTLTLSGWAQAVDSLGWPNRQSPDERESLPMALTHRLAEWLDIRDGKPHHDTLYLQRRPKRLRLRFSLKGYGSTLDVWGKHQDHDLTAHLEAQNKYTLGVSAHYRGLSLSLALNPLKWVGRNKDYELAVQAYGNKLGADIVYQSANTFRGDVTVGSAVSPVSTGMVSQDLLIVCAYYAFNGRRFSYPAVFGQSWMQRRSCGSWMVGMSLMGRSLKVEQNAEAWGDALNLDALYFSMGFGYGYNLTLSSGWLLHLSAIPELVVHSRSRMTVGDERISVSTRFPEILSTGRLSVTRTFGRYFLGLNSVVNVSNVGDRNQLKVQNIKWQARLYFGLQL